MFRTDAEELDRGARRINFGPFERRRPGFTLPRCFESQMSGIRPHGRHEVSTPKHSSSVQAFSETRSACRVGGGAQ